MLFSGGGTFWKSVELGLDQRPPISSSLALAYSNTTFIFIFTKHISLQLPASHWQQNRNTVPTYRDDRRSGLEISSDGGCFGRLLCFCRKQGFALWGSGSLMFFLSPSSFPTVPRIPSFSIPAAALTHPSLYIPQPFIVPSPLLGVILVSLHTTK